jgi:hypothetical protein
MVHHDAARRRRIAVRSPFRPFAAALLATLALFQALALTLLLALAHEARLDRKRMQRPGLVSRRMDAIAQPRSTSAISGSEQPTSDIICGVARNQPGGSGAGRRLGLFRASASAAPRLGSSAALRRRSALRRAGSRVASAGGRSLALRLLGLALGGVLARSHGSSAPASPRRFGAAPPLGVRSRAGSARLAEARGDDRPFADLVGRGAGRGAAASRRPSRRLPLGFSGSRFSCWARRAFSRLSRTAARAIAASRSTMSARSRDCRAAGSRSRRRSRARRLAAGPSRFDPRSAAGGMLSRLRAIIQSPARKRIGTGFSMLGK